MVRGPIGASTMTVAASAASTTAITPPGCSIVTVSATAAVPRKPSATVPGIDTVDARLIAPVTGIGGPHQHSADTGVDAADLDAVDEVGRVAGREQRARRASGKSVKVTWTGAALPGTPAIFWSPS